jgi:hypothetical protein
MQTKNCTIELQPVTCPSCLNHHSLIHSTPGTSCNPCNPPLAYTESTPYKSPTTGKPSDDPHIKPLLTTHSIVLFTDSCIKPYYTVEHTSRLPMQIRYYTCTCMYLQVTVPLTDGTTKTLLGRGGLMEALSHLQAIHTSGESEGTGVPQTRKYCLT